MLNCEVLRRLRHYVGTELCVQFLVDETPAHGRVIHRLCSTECTIGLADHKGGPGHALHAARDHQVAFTGANRIGTAAYSIESGAAESINRARRHFCRKPGQQAAHARDIAVVLTRLVGATEHHIVDRSPVDAGIPFHQCCNGQRRKIVSPNGG